MVSYMNVRNVHISEGFIPPPSATFVTVLFFTLVKLTINEHFNTNLGKIQFYLECLYYFSL